MSEKEVTNKEKKNAKMSPVVVFVCLFVCRLETEFHAVTQAGV